MASFGTTRFIKKRIKEVARLQRTDGITEREALEQVFGSENVFDRGSRSSNPLKDLTRGVTDFGEQAFRQGGQAALGGSLGGLIGLGPTGALVAGAGSGDPATNALRVDLPGINELDGTDAAAEANQKKADEDARVAQEGMDQAEAARREAIDLATSPEELAQLEEAIRVKDQANQRQQRLLDAIDPSIIEAGEQSLQLLQGQEAKILAPLRRQRLEQRKRLMNQLREQLGPGFETSSLGQQSLQRFDLETNDMLTGAQNQSLQQLFGFGLQGSQRGDQSLNNQLAVSNAFGNRASRQSNAAVGGQSGVTSAQAALQATAGSQFAGELTRALGAQNRFNQIANVASTGTGIALGNMFGKTSSLSSTTGGGNKLMRSGFDNIDTAGMTPLGFRA